ncbi:MAG: MBOAT family O-acyltransferase, partial [Gammaproteobacteria bacterium]
HVQSDKGFTRKTLLVSGITGNLLLLAYFKYANFFIDNINSLTSSNFHLNQIILPLAISFFTFQQIAFLVDTYRGNIKNVQLLDYMLFVSFFPQLISGPIVLHNEMMPQFADKNKYQKVKENISVGLALFTIGLFKKVIIADGMGEIADPLFLSANQYGSVDSVSAWWALLAYAFQIYFDFSAYSDMAIGLGRMFGVNLPFNFNSPYKAVNIFDFWNRWHMTFARFMRNHVYFPLVRNRKLKIGHHSGLVASVLLGGLWHGANWTFIVWGGLHAAFMVCNHLWHVIRRKLGHDLARKTRWGIALGVVITFTAGMLTRIFFRADSIDSAWIILQSMLGLNVPQAVAPPLSITAGQLLSMGALFVIVWILPNSQQWLANYKIGIDPFKRSGKIKVKIPYFLKNPWPVVRLTPMWGVIIGILLVMSIMNISHTQVFVYFQF